MPSTHRWQLKSLNYSPGEPPEGGGGVLKLGSLALSITGPLCPSPGALFNNRAFKLRSTSDAFMEDASVPLSVCGMWLVVWRVAAELTWAWPMGAAFMEGGLTTTNKYEANKVFRDI